MGILDMFKRKNECDDVLEYEKQTNYHNSNFKMEISDVFTITGHGVVLVGKVESGSISINDSFKIEGYDDTEVLVEGIEAFKNKVKSAHTGENIGILISPNPMVIFKSSMVIYK